MAAPNKRELQAQERRKQLISTALKLFAEKGMENTTIKDIAVEAGVAQGLIYHYFRSKEELFYAIIGEFNPLPEMSEILVGAQDRPANEVLTRAVLRVRELLAERGDLVRVMLREAFTRPEMLRGIRMLQAVATGLLTRYLTARIEAGELRQHDPEISARMLMGTVAALFLSDAATEANLRKTVATLLCGIAATP
jgi:AcrR family transcriptional regulator